MNAEVKIGKIKLMAENFIINWLICIWVINAKDFARRNFIRRRGKINLEDVGGGGG